MAEGAVIIVAISVDPPPIIVASVRTGGKGISETPPILNRSAPLNTVASATVPSGPSRARNEASIEFVLSYDLPGGIGLRARASVK